MPETYRIEALHRSGNWIAFPSEYNHEDGTETTKGLALLLGRETIEDFDGLHLYMPHFSAYRMVKVKHTESFEVVDHPDEGAIYVHRNGVPSCKKWYYHNDTEKSRCKMLAHEYAEGASVVASE